MITPQLTLDFAVAQTAYPGHDLAEAGDRHVIEYIEQGVLIAAIDGLGHGPKAAEAAIAAVDALRQNPSRSPVVLMEHCHRAVRGTRGAAISLASLSFIDNQLHWIGVGNVKGVLFRTEPTADNQREHLLARAGTIGYRLPTLRSHALPIYQNDVLIFVTDGVRSDFAQSVCLDLPVQELADHILEQHNRNTDDALVVVAKILASDS
jgi:hypothetical protein